MSEENKDKLKLVTPSADNVVSLNPAEDGPTPVDVMAEVQSKIGEYDAIVVVGIDKNGKVRINYSNMDLGEVCRIQKSLDIEVSQAVAEDYFGLEDGE
jgi:hypothetical protein